MFHAWFQCLQWWNRQAINAWGNHCDVIILNVFDIFKGQIPVRKHISKCKHTCMDMNIFQRCKSPSDKDTAFPINDSCSGQERTVCDWAVELGGETRLTGPAWRHSVPPCCPILSRDYSGEFSHPQSIDWNSRLHCIGIPESTELNSKLHWIWIWTSLTVQG